jgi:hypothetical protein
MRNMNVMSVCLSVFMLYFRNSRDFGETDTIIYGYRISKEWISV